MRSIFIKSICLVILVCVAIIPRGFSQNPQPKIEERKGMVGIQFSQREGQFFIFKVFKNSPAEKAGLKEGDILLRIGDKDLTGLMTADVMNLFNGEPDTEVDVLVKRGSPEALPIRVSRISPDDLQEASPEYKALSEKQAEVLEFVNEELSIPPETRRVNAWIEHFNKVYGFQSVLLDKKFGEKMGAVLDVKLNTPAFKAELEKWDIIYKIEGMPPQKFFETSEPPAESAGYVPMNITLLALTGEIRKKL
jgi:C-terminal processing protease CtpA/Prc